MKSRLVLLTVGLAIALTGTAGAASKGAENASSCGGYHGMFGMPAHGFLQDYIPVFAQAGLYKGGFVGNNASNPACHSGDSGD